MQPTDTPARAETCETCRFRGGVYRPADWGAAQIDGVTFSCRRRAPFVSGGLHAPSMVLWPWVRLADWCGEYQPKENPHAD